RIERLPSQRRAARGINGQQSEGARRPNLCSRTSRRQARGTRQRRNIECPRDRRVEVDGSRKKQQGNRLRAFHQRRHSEIARESDLCQNECRQPYRSRGERHSTRLDSTVETAASAAVL